MRRGLVLAGTAVVISFGAGSALSAPSRHTKPVAAKKIARTAQVDSRIEIVAGPERTVTVPETQPSDIDPVTKDDAFTTDSVDLVCPDGLTAIGGGFRAPDTEVVALIGSSPSPGVAGAWRIQISVQFPFSDDGTWTPYVSCAR